MKGIDIHIGEIASPFGRVRDLRVGIDRIGSGTWEEPAGPTPYPSATALRDWDRRLLARYRPFYMPLCDLCCLCTYGKCDLSGGKKGACGITMEAQQSRIVLLAASIGAATHTSHARELVEHLIERNGRTFPLDPGGLQVDLRMPHVELVCGERPETLADLETVLEYCDAQLVSLLAATHTGQEGDPIDFESKVLHAGMIDHVSMEVADVAQISALDFPKGDQDAVLVPLGLDVVDTEKPVILVVGHNVPPAAAILDYLADHGLEGTVEVTGICCTAIDMTRRSPSAKIIGPISWQLRYIRSGIPDLVVVDEQCVRTDILDEASRLGIPLIATSEKNCLGLDNRTGDPPELLIEDLASGRVPGILVFDPEKVGEVAVRVAVRRRPERSVPAAIDVVALAGACGGCGACAGACPSESDLVSGMQAAKAGDTSILAGMLRSCVGCGRCEDACPQGIEVHRLIVASCDECEQFAIRTGRGPIQDVEIREVGGPLVLGEIPGVVAFVGCANFLEGGVEVAEMVTEFAKRRFVVCTSGCSAMAVAMHRDEEGLTPYERFSGRFEAGGVVNVGSCVSNAHISGAAIKIASIFAKRKLSGNYAEVADYVYNRVGAVGVAWGAMSQKAASIAAGFWRLGIPVVVGPHGAKYRRMLLGRSDSDEDWMVRDRRSGEEVYVGPVPEHLFIAAETKEEAMAIIAKLAMRPNDTSRGRSIKLSHYIDLYDRCYGRMPDDLHRFVRTKADLPLMQKEGLLKVLEARGWVERSIPDPTLLPEEAFQ
ncbi:Prismane/CO dehydrogenase family protein [anaerobic digester metagenome]